MKTPDEIKKELERCTTYICGFPYCEGCSYGIDAEKVESDCVDALLKDALAYIQQLEHHIGELTEKVEQLEAAQPKWVSVNDMLPEKDGKYIVCTAKGSVYCTRFKAYGKSGSFQTDINTHITHWMPIPEPPKEDCNE